jgi:hypothetical protein
MKRVQIDLEHVASLANLAHAFWRASRGSPRAREVQHWRDHLETELSSLRGDILAGTLMLGDSRVFQIHDPKLRTIRAPSFRERVLHHAVMNRVGPVLDRALVDDTFACRVGKGAHAAVRRTQVHLRRYPIYVQIDIRSYFASIRHDHLLTLLARRLKGPGLLQLFAAILHAHEDSPDRGLPIGALTSQHFANFYLNSLDRYLLEEVGAMGMVRYMDDVIWWCPGWDHARESLSKFTQFLATSLSLDLKPSFTRMGQSQAGLRFCGFQVYPGILHLSPRRRQRYARARRRWESAYALGLMDAQALQAGYSSALAITAQAQARGFLRRQLRLVPPRIEC